MDDRILRFYRGGRDDEGRTLDAILAWPDDRLEDVHSFIQWLFPLPERSGANPSAPVLDAETIAAFRESAELQQRLREAFLRMLGFYGLELVSGKVQPAADFAQRSANWLTPGNHNHLRLTRMLRSLHLLGLEDESAALLDALTELYREFPGRITAATFEFWTRAAK